jgi:RES domain
VIDPAVVQTSRVRWTRARRIFRSLFPPIDLFEDVADPEDWPLLIAAEQKTNPRLMETLGALELVPPKRRVGGPGASYLMAPFAHISTDRPSRFTDGTYGVLYLAERFETALFETMHHHARFMMRTKEAPGWTSEFHELVLNLDATLHNLRGNDAAASALDPDSYVHSQTLARALRAAGSNGLVYPSCRHPDGQCAGLFYPDVADKPIPGRHLDYHWDGARVDLYRETGTRKVFRVDWNRAAEFSLRF